MPRTILPLAIAALLIAGPALANVGPVFLPDLTFPAPVPTPDLSTQGCVPPLSCK